MNRNKLFAASFFAILNVAAFSAHADVKTRRLWQPVPAPSRLTRSAR